VVAQPCGRSAGLVTLCKGLKVQLVTVPILADCINVELVKLCAEETNANLLVLTVHFVHEL
jgi:hypothetical protein